MTIHARAWAAKDSIHRLIVLAPSAMQVTEEDGGRLNAFAREPRMVVMDQAEASASSSRLLLIGGSVLVVVLVLVATWIS